MATPGANPPLENGPRIKSARVPRLSLGSIRAEEERNERKGRGEEERDPRPIHALDVGTALGTFIPRSGDSSHPTAIGGG